MREVDTHSLERSALLIDDATFNPMTSFQGNRDLRGPVRRPGLDFQSLGGEAFPPDEHFLAEGAHEEIVETEPAVRTGFRLALEVRRHARVEDLGADDRSPIGIDDTTRDRAAMGTRLHREIERVFRAGHVGRDLLTQEVVLRGMETHVQPERQMRVAKPSVVTCLNIGELLTYTFGKGADSNSGQGFSGGVAYDAFEFSAGTEQEFLLGVRAIFEVDPTRHLREAISPDLQVPLLGRQGLDSDHTVAVGRKVLGEAAPADMHGRIRDRPAGCRFFHLSCHKNSGEKPQLHGLGSVSRFGQDDDLTSRLSRTRGQFAHVRPDSVTPGCQTVEGEPPVRIARRTLQRVRTDVVLLAIRRGRQEDDFSTSDRLSAGTANHSPRDPACSLGRDHRVDCGRGSGRTNRFVRSGGQWHRMSARDRDYQEDSTRSESPSCPGTQRRMATRFVEHRLHSSLQGIAPGHGQGRRKPANPHGFRQVEELMRSTPWDVPRRG